MDRNDRLVIYQQDCESLRYQDGLRWSRFQTILTMEAAYLAALYSGKVISAGPKIGLVLSATALVLVACLFALRDDVDAERHLRRVKTMEALMGAPPFPEGAVPKVFNGVTGRALMFVTVTVLNGCNVVIVIQALRNL